MLKKNIFIAFVLMLISIFLLTTIPTYANVELASRQNHTKKSKSKKHGKRSKSKKHGKKSKSKKHGKSSGQKKSAGYPSWVSWTWKLNIVRNKKENDPKSSNYYKLKIDITYKNKSKDKIIKSFFNKSISVSFDQCVRTPMSSYCDIKYKGKYYDRISHCQSNEISYTKPVKCTIYPGESYTMTYNIPFSKFHWKQKYNPKEHSLIRYKVSHKFQVQKQNMDVD